jgi:hypothetical protein
MSPSPENVRENAPVIVLLLNVSSPASEWIVAFAASVIEP